MHSDVFRLLNSSLSSPLVKVEIILLCAARKREDGVGEKQLLPLREAFGQRALSLLSLSFFTNSKSEKA